MDFEPIWKSRNASSLEPPAVLTLLLGSASLRQTSWISLSFTDVFVENRALRLPSILSPVIAPILFAGRDAELRPMSARTKFTLGACAIALVLAGVYFWTPVDSN